MLIAAAWIYTQIAIATAAVLAVGESLGRRLAAAGFIGLGVILPWFAPPRPLLRVVLAQLILLAFLKVTQIASAPRNFPPMRRAWHFFALFHVDRARPTPPRFSMHRCAVIAGWGILVVVSILGLVETRHGAVTGWTFVFMRMICALTLFHGLMEFVCELPRLFYLMAGIYVPPNQHTPILSRTVREFWGFRWNRLVSEWLGRYTFQPFVRRHHVRLGIFVTFFVSGLMHFWLTVVPLDARAALTMGSYFILHGVIVLAELRLHPRAWPVPLARAWTLIAILGPSSLIIDPFLQILGL